MHACIHTYIYTYINMSSQGCTQLRESTRSKSGGRTFKFPSNFGPLSPVPFILVGNSEHTDHYSSGRTGHYSSEHTGHKAVGVQVIIAVSVQAITAVSVQVITVVSVQVITTVSIQFITTDISSYHCTYINKNRMYK